jgi:hypothetical protein
LRPSRNLSRRPEHEGYRFRVGSATYGGRVGYALSPPSRQAQFWQLDFAPFRSEVKKVFKSKIPVKDRDDWQNYHAEKSADVIKLTTEIKAAQCEIDAIVYKIFDLTSDETKLLEESLEE